MMKLREWFRGPWPSEFPNCQSFNGKKWFTDFQCGRTNNGDVERSKRPIEVPLPVIIVKIYEMVLTYGD